jgi:DNA-binding transcriptional ArsR family regulator
MSGSEEEIYSTMFSSLKHPARRKILRMLSDKTMTFSQMLESLAVPSSHLTYHLENLGELVVKDDNGKYKLSSFGKASVTLMKGAEEVPDIHANRFSALNIRWKTFFVALTIATLLLASMSIVQYASLNQLSMSFANLQKDYDRVKTENEQLLSWSSSANKAMIMLKDVIELDISKYQASLIGSPTAEFRNDLGGIVEEITKYSLVNSVSRLEVTLRYRNNEFSLFRLDQIEGAPNFPPIYINPQPTDNIDVAKELLQRYQSTTNKNYLEDMVALIASANSNTTEKTQGNTKLIICNLFDRSEITLQYTASGVDFIGKTLKITIQNHIVTEFHDDWALYSIGSNQLNVSREQAIQIARNAAEEYVWTSGGTQVSDFIVLDTPVTAEFYPHTRPANSVMLYPYWYVTLHLDKTYPGGVNVIAVGVWADTGEVANIQALGTQT